MAPHFGYEFPRALDPYPRALCVQRETCIIVSAESGIEGVDQPAMVLGIEPTHLHEVLCESGMNTGVFPIAKIPFAQECLN